MGKVKLAGAGEVRVLARQVALDTQASLRHMVEGQHTFHFDDRSTVAAPVDIIRWASEHIPSSTRTLHLRNMLLNGVAAAEGRSAGSGPITLSVACELISGASVSPIESSIASVREAGTELLHRSRRCSSGEALSVISGYDADGLSLDITRDALKLCSSNASLSVESGAPLTRVEVVEGHSFPCQIPEVFQSSARLASRKTLRDPRVLVIDGIVERMSELEGVIGECHVSRTPLVVFARGFDPDVQNTLGRNFTHVGLQAFPIVVPFDELGANLLNDISIVTGADLISSLKGELVTSRRWSDLRPVVSIELSEGRVTVINEASSRDVRLQRRSLREKRLRAVSQEIDIIDRRLKCLMGSGVSISLGSEMGSLQGIRRDRIGANVRLFRSIARDGMAPISEAARGHLGSALSPLSSRLEWVPAGALATGIRTGISVAQGVCSVGGMVYADRRDRG